MSIQDEARKALARFDKVGMADDPDEELMESAHQMSQVLSDLLASRKPESAPAKPVQVEVTNDTVERAAKAYWVESEREVFPESPTGDWSAEERDRFMWAARIVLSSALGGGDHAAE